MKKVLDVLDYIFYRSYLFFCSYRIFKDMEQIDAVGVVYTICFFPIFCILGYISHRTGIMFFVKYEKSYYIALVVALFGFVPIERRYIRNDIITKNSYELFRERWKGETLKQRKFKGWLVFLLIVFMVILLPITFVVLMKYNII